MLNLNGLWLMGQSYFESMRELYTGIEVDPEKFDAFVERVSSADAGGSSTVIRDGVAHIPVMGPLVSEPDVFFSIFGGGGGAVYGDIRQAVNAADADADVSKIVLEFDSPGGDVQGFMETADTIRNAKTSIEAHINGQALSAAYGLASQADQIIVDNPMAMVGAVGVVTTRFVSDMRVTLRSTDAPLKNPDPRTEEGAEAITGELDALHAEFVGVIAAGRSQATGETVSADDVNADFGRGGIVLGRAALASGMIDAISGMSEGDGRTPSSSPTTARNGDQSMNLDELKAKYPELFAAARAEGFEAGIAQERDRVAAHATAAEACGDPSIALGFIADGSDFTSQAVQAKYMTARTNTDDEKNRVDDDDDANTKTGAKNEGDPEAKDEKAKTEEMFSGLRNDLGIDGE